MEGLFQIFIIGINNKTRVYNISFSTKISEIYDHINKKYNISHDHFYLLHNTKQLDNINISIDEFNSRFDTEQNKIRKESNIRLIYRGVKKN